MHVLRLTHDDLSDPEPRPGDHHQLHHDDIPEHGCRHHRRRFVLLPRSRATLPELRHDRLERRLRPGLEPLATRLLPPQHRPEPGDVRAAGRIDRRARLHGRRPRSSPTPTTRASTTSRSSTRARERSRRSSSRSWPKRTIGWLRNGRGTGSRRMAHEGDQVPAGPSLAEQVSRLYDLIAGYHLTNLIEVGRALGVWEAITRPTRDRLGGARGCPRDGPRLHRHPVPHGVLVPDPRARRRRLADGAAHGRDPRRSRFALLPRSGRDGPSAARRRGLPGPGRPDPARPRGLLCGPQRRVHQRDRATASARCPGSSSTSCCRACRPSRARLAAGARVLDLGCGAGWAIVELAERFPTSRVDGADIEPRSVELAADRIVAPGSGRPLRRATARPGRPDRRRDVRRHHDVPRRPRDRAGPEGRRHRVGRSGADARRLARHLRRGLPRHRRGHAHDAEPVHRGRAVVRVDVGQSDRYGRRRCGPGSSEPGFG